MTGSEPRDPAERGRAWLRLASRTRAVGDSPFEAEFVERVLSRVSALEPEMVNLQQTFVTSEGRRHRMDFTIEHAGARVAVEVDGYDKTGRGSGQTREEYDAWVAREGELRVLGWQLFRTSNDDFKRRPEKVAEDLAEVLRHERTRAANETAVLAREAKQAPAVVGTASRSGISVVGVVAAIAVAIAALVLLTSQGSRSPSLPPSTNPRATGPAPTSASGQVSFTSVRSPVARGSAAQVVVRTASGASCSITVTYRSGPSAAQGLGPKSADAAGNVTWSWIVGDSTATGSWPIDVKCGSASASAMFTVQ